MTFSASFSGIIFLIFLVLFLSFLYMWLYHLASGPDDTQQFEPAKSKTAFRTARYLVALLWHWSIPFVFGCLAASVVSLMGIQQGLMQVTDVLDEAIQQAVQACQTEQ